MAHRTETAVTLLGSDYHVHLCMYVHLYVCMHIHVDILVRQQTHMCGMCASCVGGLGDWAWKEASLVPPLRNAHEESVALARP